MNVRKQRQHQCGLTNIDFRTKGDHAATDRYNPTLKFAEVGTMSKANFKNLINEANPTDQWKTKGGWMPVKKHDPRSETTAEFYASVGKKPKAPVLVSNLKGNELEAEKWTDKVFTGDNPKTTALLSNEARQRDATINP